MSWLRFIWALVKAHWKLAITAGLAALAGLWVHVVKLLTGFQEIRAAKARADKALAERDIARVELEKLKAETIEREQARHVKELGERIRSHAESLKRAKAPANLLFSEEELASVLGEEREKLSEVMQQLESTGHAKRSRFFRGKWEIDSDDSASESTYPPAY